MLKYRQVLLDVTACVKVSYTLVPNLGHIMRNILM
jgi:hypothetical protein